MKSTRKHAGYRPLKRNIVRWDENLNEQLLLTIQSVCNINSIKIPWNKVAETMGKTVSEGAIIQHLAKLRSRRIEAGKVVPPPLRRGAIGTCKLSNLVVSTTVRKTRAHKRNKEPGNEDDPDYGGASVERDARGDNGKEIHSKKVPHGRSRGTARLVGHRDGGAGESETEQDSITAGDENLVDALASGSSFFETSISQSDPMTPAERSKIIVLRYGKGRHSSSRAIQSADVELVDDYTRPIDWLQSMAYGVLPQLEPTGPSAETPCSRHNLSFPGVVQGMPSHNNLPTTLVLGGIHNLGGGLQGSHSSSSFVDFPPSVTYPSYEDSYSNVADSSEAYDIMSPTEYPHPEIYGIDLNGQYSYEASDSIYLRWQTDS